MCSILKVKFIKGNVELKNIELKHYKYYILLRVSVDDTYASEMLNSESWPEEVFLILKNLIKGSKDIQAKLLFKRSINRSFS